MSTDITSVGSLLEAIDSTGYLKRDHAHVRVWFRGHGSDQWPLEPGVYRRDFAPDETARQLNERHLTQDFLALSAPLITERRSDPEIYFLQQHYRMPTRLLDWSLNPLAALYFALNPDTQGDGMFYMLDAYHFAEGRGLCTPRSDDVAIAMQAIFGWIDIWPNAILSIRPFNIDPRIASQRGCFTFHPPQEATLNLSHEALKMFRIPAASKLALSESLDLLGFDEFTIYNDLDNLAKRLRRAYRK